VELYEALLMLQHRGQDSAGIVTTDGPRFHEHKANGLVADVFRDQATLDGLAGSVGLGHVRYPTAGTASAAEAQPFFVNSPLGIYLIHNGNLTNTDELRTMLEGSASFFSRHLRTQSDSEVLLNVLADEVHRAHQRCMAAGDDPNPRKLAFVLEAGEATMRLLRGAYSCVALVKGVGLVAFRDPFGIRPLVLGARPATDGRGGTDWCVASEDCAFGPIGFERVRDVAPGEMIIITDDGRLVTHQCARGQTCPCIFEYIYLARPDSVLNGISVYNFQLGLGTRLAAAGRVAAGHGERLAAEGEIFSSHHGFSHRTRHHLVQNPSQVLLCGCVLDGDEHRSKRLQGIGCGNERDQKWNPLAAFGGVIHDELHLRFTGGHRVPDIVGKHGIVIPEKFGNRDLARLE
jgi:amidophosphoribosyltransferase